MHTPKLSFEALDLLWHNYHLTGQYVDLGRMPSEKAIACVQNPKYSLRKMGIAAYLSNIGCYISVWALWELYSWELCKQLPNPGDGEGTCVDQVASSLAANVIQFPQKDWFVGALALRNLIAHYSGRVSGERAAKHFQKAKAVFPSLESNAADYVTVEFEQVCDLHINVSDFIRNSAAHYSSVASDEKKPHR